ncbi:MAG: 23S rRNA (uracil(1939)-C(5))-methyltransferase RlmD [Lachnospiraceae bacterium]|nr:23S rRNA (uracil(1939)-C(5))-methyltransferase RlmD [Lachnospiraceae bacterium]
MQKNDVIEVTIEDMSAAGEGIGKADGFPLFVKDAIIGDTAKVKVMKVKKNYAYARLMEIVMPSVFRVPAKCPIARPCGGCQIQEMVYEKQLEWKETKVVNNLKRIGGFSEELLKEIVEPIVGMEKPFRYRNKAQFPFGTDRSGKIVTGFYAGRTHNIIANTDCPLGVEINQRVLEHVMDYMEQMQIKAYDEETGSGLVRHVLIRYGFVTKEIMVCLVLNAEDTTGLKQVERLIEALMQIEGMTGIVVNFNQKRNNVILGASCETLWGQNYITDYIGSIQYQISSLSFFQVNPRQTERLYGLALAYADLKGHERVWDMYCGIGTIALFFSQKAKEVIGVEVVPQAIEDAKENARINKIENTTFYVGKAEVVLLQLYHEVERQREEVVVVDPPRKGCDKKLLETIVEMSPEKVVYVSCDSATLARDLKFLCGNGYGLRRVRAVDLFPMTVHVECVTLLTRSEATQ